MSHGLVEGEKRPRISPANLPSVLATLTSLFEWLDRLFVIIASLALVAGALVLTQSVVVRYALKATTDWQDETTVFLLVAATFLSAPWVQARRGHVAIEALSEILSPRVNHWRVLLADMISFAFCTFFSWKAWTLFREAWEDGQVTSSSWGPPLWIPYSTMSLGMSILSLRILLQVISAFWGRRS